MSHTAQLDKHIYMDYASFSPIDKELLTSMEKYYGSNYGNPSSLHLCGRNAKQELYKAKEVMASVLSTAPEEIFFTSSGTEANLMAIAGIARSYQQKGNHIIVSAIEHASILETAKKLQREGFSVSIAPVKKNGVLDIDACISLITPNTILLSCMYVNNEIGTIQPIEELCRRVRAIQKEGFPLLHTDACQAGNILPLSVKQLGADLMTLNSTKVSGPAGVGLLYKRKDILIDPLIVGGEQEYGVRAGTEAVPLCIAFSLALKKAQERKNEEYSRLLALRQYFIAGLLKEIPDIHIHGDMATQSPAIIHVTVPYIEGESMLLLLDSWGVYVSTGSACASYKIAPSHVLVAIGQNEEIIHGSIRFSMGRETTQEDIDYVLVVFPEVVTRLRSLSALKKITV